MNKDVDVTIVVMIVILLIVLFVFIIACLLNWDSYQQSIRCGENECPTSLITGEKDCSRSIFNPTYEVCSIRDACSTDILPEAVNSDLGTTSGSCEEGRECRCSRQPLCPIYNLIVFTQQSNGVIEQLPPDEEGNCSISVEALFATGGYCTPVDWSNEENKKSDIIQCIQDNPCIVGQAAYIANPNDFRSNDYSYYPIGCVPGTTGFDSFNNPIQSNSVPIWDDQWGGVVQKNLS